MAKKPRKCKVAIKDAYDYDEKEGGFFQPKYGIEYTFECKGAAYSGNTFSPKACSKLIFEKLKSIRSEELHNNFAIEFGRDSLLRILSQEGCEAIRFAFCKTIDANKKISADDSLVAMGLDKDGKLLKAEYYYPDHVYNQDTAEPPLAEEKGNGISGQKILDEMKMKQTDMTIQTFVETFSKNLL